METKFQTSFIPKTNLEPVRGAVKRPMGLFAFLATIIFFISAVIAAGAFGWDKYLEGKKTQMQADLEKNIKAFEPQTIEQYVRLDNRINASKELLAKHVAVSYVFDFLQDKTLQSVGFTDFKYNVGADGTALLSLNGVAKSYNAVAYQSTVFGNERALKGPIFSNLDLDNSGNVVFNFTTNVDPGFITYTRKAAQGDARVSNDIVPLQSGSADALGSGPMTFPTGTASSSSKTATKSTTKTTK
jgi:nitrate reductase NapE component